MAQGQTTPADPTREPGQQADTDNLTKHQRAIIDYAAAAAATANRVQTEEVIARTRTVVQTELNSAFATYSKVSTTQKVLLGIGAAVVFGLGFLTKGWIGDRDEDEDTDRNNGVMD